MSKKNSYTAPKTNPKIVSYGNKRYIVDFENGFRIDYDLFIKFCEKEPLPLVKQTKI